MSASISGEMAPVPPGGQPENPSYLRGRGGVRPCAPPEAALSVGGRGFFGAAGPSLRVLLVEDNAGDARLVREALADSPLLPAEVTLARTLHEALDAVCARPTDAILLDLGLPDASGLDALHALAAAAPQVPIVVLTGHADDEFALLTLRAGAQDYLAKGEVAGPTLARALRYALERKRLQKVDRFISGAAQLLGSSLSLEETLGQLADLSVADLADFCVVDLLDVDGKVDRVVVAHRARGQREAAEQLRTLELDRHRPHLAYEATLRREPVLVDEVTGAHLAAVTQNPEHAALLAALNLRSYMAVPLLTGEKLLGVLVLISGTVRFTDEDLGLSRRFAGIAAAAIHNARLYEQSAEALRTRDRVLGVVAHDLRNPLSTIAMSAELLLENELPELQRHKQLEIIRRSAQRMNRLIDDLLDVARIEHGSLMLDLSYRQPEAIVREVVESNSSLAAARNLSVVVSGDSPGPVLVDYHRLLQVLSNLIGNALKFTPPGGVVRVGAQEAGGDVLFFVADTGPGIPEDERVQLFRPFWQGRRKRGEGAGLGLSIARGIVEAHGGKIWAESSPDGGTTMYFTIPRAEERRGTDAVPGTTGAG